jgi:hypothetical protein
VARVVDQGIGVEPRVGHHTVDEVVYDGRDAVDTAEPLVKVGRILCAIGTSSTPGRGHSFAVELGLVPLRSLSATIARKSGIR